MKDLRLASDTAVAKVSKTDPIEKTARALGVNLIVQGIIQGSADKMAIIVNLIDVADGGKKLWSQQFTGVPKDLLTLEDQISGQLVTALDLKPTNEELARTAERPDRERGCVRFVLARSPGSDEGLNHRRKRPKQRLISFKRVSTRIRDLLWLIRAFLTRV